MPKTVDRRWLPIAGTGERFFIADDGTVRGPQGDAAPYPNAHGRLLVKVNGRARRLPQLVIEHFEPQDHPGLWLIHRDGDFTNCRLANLAWVSEHAYRQHQIRLRGVDPVKQRIRACKIENMFLSLEKRQEPFQPPQQESEPQPAPSRARKPSEAPISARSWARKPSEELLQRIVPISNSENQPCKVCVCNDGTVRTLEGRLLRPSMDHKGHWKVTFHTHNGRRVELGVASLVLRGFPLLKDSGGSDLSVDLQKALRDLRPSQHG